MDHNKRKPEPRRQSNKTKGQYIRRKMYPTNTYFFTQLKARAYTGSYGNLMQ